jgi:hypothetical protein
MKLSEDLFGDFHTRLRGDGILRQQNNIWQAGKNFWRDYSSNGVDQSLARVRWRDGVGENALARMERFGPFAGDRFGNVATRAWRGGRGSRGKSQRREIIDWAGPGELKIFKRWIFALGCEEIRPGRQQKNNVPQGGCDYRGARDAAFDRAISEDIFAYKLLSWSGASDERVDAASETLVKAVPADFELRSGGRWG